MRQNAVVSSLAATALLASFGAGCAVAQDEHDHRHQPAPAGAAANTATPATGQSAGQSRDTPTHVGGMDMKAMCDMHRQMMSKHSESERKAFSDREMKGMSAEQKEQHMKMMDEQCK